MTTLYALLVEAAELPSKQVPIQRELQRRRGWDIMPEYPSGHTLEIERAILSTYTGNPAVLHAIGGKTLESDVEALAAPVCGWGWLGFHRRDPKRHESVQALEELLPYANILRLGGARNLEMLPIMTLMSISAVEPRIQPSATAYFIAAGIGFALDVCMKFTERRRVSFQLEQARQEAAYIDTVLYRHVKERPHG